jgi:hypothetical protein
MVVDPCGCNDGSRRIWSLLDIMNRFDLYGMRENLSLSDILESAFGAEKIHTNDGSRLLSERELRGIDFALDHIDSWADKHDFPNIYKLARRTKGHIHRPMTDVSAAQAHLHAFNVAVLDGLKDMVFLRVAEERSEFLDADDLFGVAVATAFPSSVNDIREAGNCLAAGCDTASVFHLMRAVEFALRALARDRSVIFKDKPLDEKEWGQILSSLEAKLSELRQAPRTNWSSGDARESHVSHADAHAFYDGDQARSVFNHVRALMRKLAIKISEVSATPEFWTAA